MSRTLTRTGRVLSLVSLFTDLACDRSIRPCHRAWGPSPSGGCISSSAGAGPSCAPWCA